MGSSRTASTGEVQLSIDWTKPAAQPKKQKILDALAPCCGCVRKVNATTGKPGRGCACAKRLRAILRALDTFQQKNVFCWPSVESIAARVGCTPRNARRLIRLGERLGFIRTDQHRNNTSHYRIDWLAIWNTVEEGRTICPPAGGQNANPVTDNLSGQGGQFVPTPPGQFVRQNSTSLNSNEFKHDGEPEKAKAKGFGDLEGEGTQWHCHIEPDQLRNIGFLIDTFTPRAQQQQVVPAGRNGELIVLAAAFVALKGENPGGLLWKLLRDKSLRWKSPEAIEAAFQRLSRYRRSSMPAGAH